MIQHQTAPYSPRLFSSCLSGRLKHLFCICLVISIMLHLLISIGFIISYTQSKTGTTISYIDIHETSAPSQQLIPAMSSPVQQAEQPDPAPEPSADSIDAANNSSKETTADTASGDLSSTLEQGMANGYFSSLAEGRTLRDDIRGYYFDILEKINNIWWQKSGSLTEIARQEGIIEIVIDRSGKLVDSRPLKSTGSRLVDKAIIEAINEASPFPYLPASYEMGFFRAPLKISKPSYLFGARNVRP